MPKFKDQAICIRHHDWSETSQVVALLTAEHGKLRGIAKGSRRTSPGAIARFCGGIELLTRGQVVATSKATVELATITEWDLEDPYRHLRQDLAAQNLALYGVDLVNAMLADRDPHPGTFAALAAFLAALALPAGRDAALLLFQWRVLDDCGYKPELERDVHAGAALADRPTYTFYPASGGVSAEEAAGHSGGGFEAPGGPWGVRRETVEVLRAVAREAAAGTPALSTEAPALRRANRLLCFYARTILDRELPTMGAVLDW